ncbi:MAG: ABC transporter ATP-binding protein [Cyanobacteria bacterium P01_C01_bin.120]
MNPAVILKLDSLTKQFAGQSSPAVDQISLTLPQGDLLGLLGPSGCGKTTLLRIIAGFERPESGSIELSGRAVCGRGVWMPPERRNVGVVFQDYALFPHLSVFDNVAFGLKTLVRHGKLAAAEMATEAERAIALVGLQKFVQRFPHELSGGQQQRVALARAIAPRPTLILLDEPFSNLDVQVRLYLRQEVRDILKNVGISSVFVTHDQEEALSISDCLAVMQAGRIEQFGPPESVYQQPNSRFVAGFVTQANFVAAERQGKMWRTLLGIFPAVEKAVQDQVGELMVRQEDLQLQASSEGNLVVRDRQFLGREYRYTVTTAQGDLLYARTTTHQRLEIGQTVSGTVNTQQPQVFSQLPVNQ